MLTVEYSPDLMFAAGREEGREEGALRKALEIARHLFSLKLPAKDIAVATGLSVDEVDNLAQQP